MRFFRQAALALSVIILVPLAAVSTTATVPSGFTPISADDFRPVVVPPLHDAAVLPPKPTAAIPVIYERVVARPAPSSAARVQPEAKVKVIVKVTPKPLSRIANSGRSRRGLATWYCKAGRSVCHFKYPDHPGCNFQTFKNCDFNAAAGPALRVGNWRGRVVQVCSHHGTTCIPVKLVDYCACMNGTTGRIIDLYFDAFDYLSRGSGGEPVTVTW